MQNTSRKSLMAVLLSSALVTGPSNAFASPSDQTQVEETASTIAAMAPQSVPVVQGDLGINALEVIYEANGMQVGVNTATMAAKIQTVENIPAEEVAPGDLPVDDEPAGDNPVEDGPADTEPAAPAAAEAASAVPLTMSPLRDGDQPQYIGEASDGSLVFEETGAYSAVNTSVQFVEDGSVRYVNVIEDASAPTTFSYLLTVPSGGVAALGPDGDSVTVTDAAGALVGAVAAPWARDAAGNDVPTHYGLVPVSATTVKLVQTVDHDSDGVVYPVAADPYLGKALISKVTIGQRSGGTTLFVYPTLWMRANYNNPTVVNNLWYEYKSKVAARYETTQLWWQLACHVQAAPWKTSWNLDTWRYRTSYLSYVTHACN
ncbi:DUF2599 domain-containing protein [Promicromonospora sp. NPDC050262]|uniref:DUF2599 domain-containing protein n=1 Tax=Promicromonospora sp. NPDC050262 TaxID=3155036 RepID=UPI00340A318E